MSLNNTFCLGISSILLGFSLHGAPVNSASDLNTEISNSNSVPATIDFGSSFSNTTVNFRPLNSTTGFNFANVSYTIDGNGFTLSTTGNFRGFSSAGLSGSTTGTITIQDLIIDGAIAKGGEGPGKGGGGAGLGGGLFVGTGANIILQNVAFNNCQAIGGSSSSVNSSGGGGGLGGDGGDIGNQVNTGGGGGGFFGNGGSGSTVGAFFAAGGGGGANTNGLNGDGTDGTGGNGGNNFSSTAPGGGGSGGAAAGFPGGNGQGGGGAGFALSAPGGDGGFGGGGGGATKNSANFASGGAGGTFGGGGGGGSFAGGGLAGGDGGFGAGGGAGGFGAGTFKSGDGGFGGGGAGSGSGIAGTEGIGGFGGGDGSINGAGGGGAGFGGAIFIQNGGNLEIIESISFSTNTVTAGTGNQSGSEMGADIFMMSGGEITFTLGSASNINIPNAIESDQFSGGGSGGGIILNGSSSGVVTLNGDNTFTGTTTINSGNLVVNGSIITDVTIGSSGRLSGGPIAQIGGNIINNGGVVAPGNSFGTLVSGDFTQNAAGVLEIEIGSNGDNDKLFVNGTATLDGTLEIVALSGNYLAGTQWNVISASLGVVNEFSNVIFTGLGELPSEFSVVYSANDVNFLILSSSIGQSQNISPGNPQTVIDYINSLQPIDPNSDLGQVVVELGTLSDDEVNDALNQMTPARFGAFELTNLDHNHQVSSILSQHLFQIACECRAACYNNIRCANSGAWGSLYGDIANYDRIQSLNGFKAKNGGVIVGLYRNMGRNTYLGLTGGYARSELKYKQNLGKGWTDQFYGGLYGGYVGCMFSADAALFAGGNHYDINRQLSFGNIDRTAKDKHWGYPVTAHLGAAVRWSSGCMTWKPYGMLDYNYLHFQGFEESGADSLDLDVRSKDSQMLRSELGIVFLQNFSCKCYCFTPYVGGAWVYKSHLNNGNYEANFLGEPGSFTAFSFDKSLSMGYPKVGVVFTIPKCNTSVLGEYSAEIGSGELVHYANIKVEYRF